MLLMLLKNREPKSGKILYRTKPLLLSPTIGYVRPTEGKAWFATTTTVWRIDELISRRVRDWKRLLHEDGHTGARAETFRKSHDSAYTATHSIFAAPLCEWILLRYGGIVGSSVLDAFAGGSVRAVVASIMGYHYTGYEIRQQQIDENVAVLKEMGLDNWTYVCGDGRWLGLGCEDEKHHDLIYAPETKYDFGFTCPPYYDLEKYSDDPHDLSNLGSYAEFNASMFFCALNYFERLKPGAFCCIVVGPFRAKKGKELIDFPGDTVRNFRDVGFTYWQQIVLCKNFASAAIRSTNAWSGKKLVPQHEFLLVFRKPELNRGEHND